MSMLTAGLSISKSSCWSRTFLYLLELNLHARHQHDAGHTHAQEQEEGVDEACHRGVVSRRAASTQQTGGAAAQAWDLFTQSRVSCADSFPTLVTILTADVVTVAQRAQHAANRNNRAVEKIKPKGAFTPIRQI